MDKLLVQGKGTSMREPLNCLLVDSFYIEWQMNSTYQIQFTAYDDHSLAYSMLDSESMLFWQGQEFIIKQCIPDYSKGVSSKQIVATHIMYECMRVYQYNSNSNTQSYSVNDVLNYYFNGNNLGFTWQVIGNFSNALIQGLGNGSGKDCLSKITSAWSNAVIFPDNQCIKVYSTDEFEKDLGNRIDYLHDSEEVKLTYDSTTITNYTKCISSTYSVNNKDVKYFDDFIVQNDDSINKWGIHPMAAVSNDNLHDANSAKQYALSQMQPEPALSIEVTSMTNNQLVPQPVAGELKHLFVKQANLATTVAVVGYQWYPLSYSQSTTITLNNTAKTIFDYQAAHQNSINNALSEIKQTNNSLVNNMTTTINAGESVISYDG